MEIVRRNSTSDLKNSNVFFKSYSRVWLKKNQKKNEVRTKFEFFDFIFHRCYYYHFHLYAYASLIRNHRLRSAVLKASGIHIRIK